MSVFTENPVPDFLKITSVTSAFRSERNLSNAEIPGEAHSFWEFLYVEQGDINILVDGELFCLHQGELIIYTPHSFHAVAATKKCIINVVCFDTKSSAMFDFASNVIRITEQQHNVISEIISQADDILSPVSRGKGISGMILRENIPKYRIQKFVNLIELFLLDLYEQNAKCTPLISSNYQNERYAKLISYLKNNINRALSLEEISCACSMSVPALHKLCKRQCGCGPITLFTSLKIGEAKRLISKNSLNFTQISEQLGFSSVHYFSKLFKLKTGMTPSGYARSIFAGKRKK